MFLTNKQKTKRYDKYERQRKDIVRLRAEIEILKKNVDEGVNKIKAMQEQLKEMLEEILGQRDLGKEGL